MQTTKQLSINCDTQGYRSGHNEAVLKTVCPQGRVGSNPTPCAFFCLKTDVQKKIKKFLTNEKHFDRIIKLSQDRELKTEFKKIKPRRVPAQAEPEGLPRRARSYQHLQHGERSVYVFRTVQRRGHAFRAGAGHRVGQRVP